MATLTPMAEHAIGTALWLREEPATLCGLNSQQHQPIGSPGDSIGAMVALGTTELPLRGTLDLSAAKEQLNLAYVQSVVAAARCMWSVSTPDHEKVDLTVKQAANHLRYTQSVVDLQLKATSQDVLKTDHVAFKLEAEDYNALCEEKLYNPRILVVFIVPEDSNRWLYQHDRAMLMRDCAYWVSLRGELKTEQGSKVVHLPTKQKFDVNGLCGILKRIGDGDLP